MAVATGQLPEMLAVLEEKTRILYDSSDSPRASLFIDRANVYRDLGYHDLAAADAYRAIDLVENFSDSEDEPEDSEEKESAEKSEDKQLLHMYDMLIDCLTVLGCTQDAFDLIQTADQYAKDDEDRKRLDQLTLDLALRCFQGRRPAGASADVEEKPDDGREKQIKTEDLTIRGMARREVYQWNHHEPDRSSPSILKKLNERLSKVAPKCEVKSVTLPKMHENDLSSSETSTQLGLIATSNIEPGEIILLESSILTSTNRIYSDLCDACRCPLPGLVKLKTSPTGCRECFDTIYCSDKCRDMAADTYHPAVCGKEGLQYIGTDNSNTLDADDSLYLNLVARVIAMAETQSVHPLDLPEVKYLWGDFDVSPIQKRLRPRLPFSLKFNVVQPIRILEEMDIDPYETLPAYDTWIINTLYAKFRAVASARQSTWDGLSEVAAVHPLWCLANHSCDPNVQWECEGDIKFAARDKRVEWGGRTAEECRGGIKIGEQIFNHYCDINLSFKERREWAKAALGGLCQCGRCKWEEEHEITE